MDSKAKTLAALKAGGRLGALVSSLAPPPWGVKEAQGTPIQWVGHTPSLNHMVR